MRKYKIVRKTNDKETHIIESNIEECELESYIRKYLHFEYFRDWLNINHDIDFEDNSFTIEYLEDNLNKYIHELCNDIVPKNTWCYLGDNLFVESYEQNIRLFISILDYGELVPVCARPDGEHKLIILDNGVVHSGTTEKPVGTINYNVSVDDSDFSNFRFCGEVVIDTYKYLGCLASEISLADMILSFFNKKAPFDIEFAEKEKQ